MSETIRLIAEFFAACVGTIAFALLFQVPRKYYLYCGLAGACGWICYKLILPYTTEPVSIFFATVLVIILSRSFAVYKRCPVTVFLIAGIFPLVPGGGIYWTAFYVVTNDLEWDACLRNPRRKRKSIRREVPGYGTGMQICGSKNSRPQGKRQKAGYPCGD